MKIVYLQNGKITTCVYDRDWFMFDNQGAVTSTLEIDEIDPDNKALCLDLVRTQGKVDESGDPKYMVTEGELMEKEGWVEVVADIGL